MACGRGLRRFGLGTGMIAELYCVFASSSGRQAIVGSISGLIMLYWGCGVVCLADATHPAGPLIRELGCGGCHMGLGLGTVVSQAPDLNFAGLRYRPEYLFDYLQNPTRVRHHIGASRMPDFHLSRRESLALTRFLAAANRKPGPWPEYPADFEKPLSQDDGVVAAGELLVKRLGCITCHSLKGKGGDQAVDLATVGYRLNKTWIKRYLANPQFFQPGTTMPNLFYRADEAGGMVERVPDAGGKIAAIVAYLYFLGKSRVSDLRAEYTRAVTRDSQLGAELGRRIFISQNCTACHVHGNVPTTRNGPDLGIEGARVKPEWLIRYLRKPIPIRPAGYRPGGGGRMPDFALSGKEAAVIGDYLMRQVGDELPDVAAGFEERLLSAFAMNKARRLLKEKLSCLGCHRLGEDGGRIGPDLSRVGNRLQPTFLYQFIRQPAALDPHAAMPTVKMPVKTLNLITNFLLQQDTPALATKYISLVDDPPRVFDGHAHGGAALYARYCAQCHGTAGEGDGFNAQHLPVVPTRHADGAYMASRPDDTLYDGVHVGGFVLAKSHRMPPWGETLSAADIRALVAHMRRLCRCSGPDWSKDN